MKVALVYDRVNKFGGAERVLLALHQLYPQAPLYTLVADTTKASWAQGIKVLPTFLNQLAFLRSRHEVLSPLAPLAFETLNLNDYDVVISVTSSDAKAVITKPQTLHLCYCLTPTRYLWSGVEEYQKDLKMKILPRWLFNYFRFVDTVTSARPDVYLSISKEIKKRVKKYYQRDSEVIYPAIADHFFSTQKPVSKSDRSYYLIVSRLVPYKKVDLAIKAFNKLGLPLLVVGTGSQLTKLKQMANQNIEFVGQVTDKELINYYQHAKAVIFPQDEDFGLVPIEAQASGTPVIAYAKGGALETILDHKTGLFFDEQTPKSLTQAVRDFEKLTLNYQDCLTQARKFSQATFLEEFSAKVRLLWQKHQQLMS